MLTKKVTWIAGLLIVAGGALLSWPFSVNQTYWAESTELWIAQVIVGCLLGLYVAVIFIHTQATLIYSEAECCKPIEERKKPVLND